MSATAQPRSAVLVLLRVLALAPAVLYGSAHSVDAHTFRSRAWTAWIDPQTASTVAPPDAIATGGADSPLGPRVRSTHAYIRAMIGEAVLRSPTFRGLVKAIEATNGIVYVEHGPCTHNIRACLAMDITPAAGYRILRVVVDARQLDWDVMASIGHELRHAVEILENPSLVNTSSIYFFYADRRDAKDRPFETHAAVDAGYAVRSEVSSFAKGKAN